MPNQKGHKIASIFLPNAIIHPSTMVIKSSNTFITYSAVLCPGWSRNLASRAFFLHKDNVVIWVGRYILRDILSGNSPRIRKASEHEEYSTNSNSNYAKISVPSINIIPRNILERCLHYYKICDPN